jgi:hypothetical protein
VTQYRSHSKLKFVEAGTYENNNVSASSKLMLPFPVQVIPAPSTKGIVLLNMEFEVWTLTVPSTNPLKPTMKTKMSIRT